MTWESPSLRVLLETLLIQVSTRTIREFMMGQVARHRMAWLDVFQPWLEARAGVGLSIGATQPEATAAGHVIGARWFSL
jgi:hypothetical protein